MKAMKTYKQCKRLFRKCRIVYVRWKRRIFWRNRFQVHLEVFSHNLSEGDQERLYAHMMLLPSAEYQIQAKPMHPQKDTSVIAHATYYYEGRLLTKLNINKSKLTNIMETGIKEMDYQSHQMEKLQDEILQEMELDHSLLQNETYGKIPDPRYSISPQFRQANAQLHKLFAVLKNELKDYPGDLSTSYVFVEKELAKCISGLLQDYPLQMRSVSCIRSLLRDYKVILPLQDGSHSISHNKVHSILEDNYKDSLLLSFMDLLSKGLHNTVPKLISIY